MRLSTLFFKLKRLKWNHQRNRLFIYLILLVILFILMIIRNLDLYPDSETERQYDWIKKHRNLSIFLNRTHTKELKCTPKTDVVVAIISTHSNFLERRAIRRSWAALLSPTWKVLFFIGNPLLNTKKRVQDEIKQYDDVIVLDLEESYLNLTLKSILMMEWIYNQCKQSKFLLKTDDDIYISPHNMQKFIGCSTTAMNSIYTNENKTECKKWDMKKIVGHYISKESRKYVSYIAAGYLYKRVHADRNPKSKWYLSPYFYKDVTLPDFLSGTSYLLSSNLIQQILSSTFHIPQVHLEDVYITGIILNNHLKLKLSHIPEWNNFRPQWNDICLYNKLLSVHGLDSVEMVYITNEVASLKNNCSSLDNIFSNINEIISYYIPRYKN